MISVEGHLNMSDIQATVVVCHSFCRLSLPLLTRAHAKPREFPSQTTLHSP